MRLFFKKIQKFGLFLSRFYAFFRVFEAKNTVPKECYFLCGWEILKVFLPACLAA